MITVAFLWCFVAVKLQHVQRNRIQRLVELAAAGIDEQADSGNERRQRGDNRASLQHRHCARAFGVKHQTDRVGPRLGRSQRIFYAGNPADLAANG